MYYKTIYPEKYAVMKWHTQDGNITTNHRVKVDFTLPALSATNIVTWKSHVDNSANGRYDMTLGRHLLTELGLNLKLSEHVIKTDDGPLKGYTTLMVDLDMYVLKVLNTGKITPEESFTKAYVEEVYESEHAHNAAKQLLVVLYNK